jgi:translation initiation factor 3 subunit C
LQINLEHVEVVYMTTSMLLEIPNISENKFTVQRDVISRNFRKLIEQYDQKGMQFVPQTSRDKIVEAARALHKSDWTEAFKRISAINMFSRLEEFQRGQLKEQLLNAFKDAALKIFVIESESQYESFSITNVCQQFGITKESLIKQVSKLIVKDTISGRIDLDSNAVIFNKESRSALSTGNRAEMDYLQSVNLDKIRQLVDSNDRCMELLVN